MYKHSKFLLTALFFIGILMTKWTGDFLNGTVESTQALEWFSEPGLYGPFGHTGKTGVHFLFLFFFLGVSYVEESQIPGILNFSESKIFSTKKNSKIHLYQLTQNGPKRTIPKFTISDQFVHFGRFLNQENHFFFVKLCIKKNIYVFQIHKQFYFFISYIFLINSYLTLPFSYQFLSSYRIHFYQLSHQFLKKAYRLL